ncbi:MAG: hypothetical protein K0V04_11860 [Deltaproteobacteria bacterium]|nr:hypothetical protein [Deltaproteobacteria bacterium]
MSPPVPDFFVQTNDDARRSQAQWLSEHMGLDGVALADVLGCSPEPLARWRDGLATLAEPHRNILDSLWSLVRHLLSFCGFDSRRARTMLDSRVPDSGSPLAPPWQGGSLRRHLRDGGARAIEQSRRFIIGLRFGPAPTAAPEDQR